MTKPAAPRAVDRVPAPALFLISGFTQYYGAAIAVGLFTVLPPAGVAWWRLSLSAVLLIAWQRPWRAGWTRRDLGTAALFGAVLATMNVSFYIAVAHLPLGVAVSIEFLGPVGVAAIGGRGWRERAGIALAAVGVVTLAASTGRGGWNSGVAIGLVAIAVSAATWAGYILLGRRVAGRQKGLSGLAVGMTVGAVLYSPLAISSTPVVLGDWRHLLALVGIAVCSSVIPYGIEQVVLRRVTAARFAILLALLPVAATITGLVILHQIPSPIELAGVAAICAAIVLSAGRPEPGESVS